MRDEGPSPEDIERFSREHAWCPECGEEIWDQAEFCPACGQYLAGKVASRSPDEGKMRSKWIIVVAIIVLIAFLLTFLRLR